WEHVVRPEYTVRFKWEAGDIAMWDNRATSHLAPTDIFDSDFDRQLYRITLVGDVPVGVDGRPSVAIKGEPILAVETELTAAAGWVVALSRVLAAAASLAVGAGERRAALGKGAVGGRLVFRRIVGAGAARDRPDDHIVVRPEEERAGVARAIIAIDHAVRRRPEPIVRVARQHRAGIDDERARHRRRPD